MKNLIGIVFIFLLLVGCSKSDNVEQENSLIGNWKLEAFVGSDGANRIVTPIENGQTIILKNDSTFEILNSGIECSMGTYSITLNSPKNYNMDILTLTCSNQNLLEYAFTFEESKLLLSFITDDGSTGCDEICAERYKSVASE